jgi:membrane-anchored mycosin MYCP
VLCVIATAGLPLVAVHPATAAANQRTGAAAPTAGVVSMPAIPHTLSGQGCTAPSDKDTMLMPWPRSFLHPEQAWPLSAGAGVTIGVVDTGVDTHGVPVLAGQVTGGPDVVGHGVADNDCVGHGTFVAGLLVAKQQNGVGFAGIAPKAHVLGVRATDRQGNTTADHIANGIRAAVDGGARVVLVSLGVASPSDALKQSVGYATDRGALVVAQATLDGQQRDGAVYPAAYPEVLSVAALGPDGTAQSMVQGARVDIAAPGDAVMSVGPGGSGYFTGSGASFAAAFVAGTAALVDAYRPALTPAQLSHRLQATAYHPGTSMPDRGVGAGTVDPSAAVATVLPEEHGKLPAPSAAAVLALPPPVSDSPQRGALAVAAGFGALILLVAFAGVAIRLGRRRGWRPGRLATAKRAVSSP